MHNNVLFYQVAAQQIIRKLYHMNVEKSKCDAVLFQQLSPSIFQKFRENKLVSTSPHNVTYPCSFCVHRQNNQL